jgi:hypothetical protein
MIEAAAKFRDFTRDGCRLQASSRLRHFSLCLSRAYVLLLPFLFSALAARGDSRPSEYDVKAAYLLNFGKFIRIESADVRGSFDVCVIGEDPIEATLKSMTAGERINDRPVRILHLKDGTAARACQIAFLSASEGPRLEQDLEELRGADVLTVSDSSTFLARGGMIEFLLISDHVRFSVNLEAVRRTHLVLSSELLRVAYAVAGKSAKEGGQ